MSKLTDRVSYLKGLADGLKMAENGETGRMILEMLNVLQEATEAIEELTDAHNDLYDYVETVDDDLADLEETLFDEEDEEEEPEWEEDETIVYDCPHCGHPIEFEASSMDFDEDCICPACGKPVFSAENQNN